VGPRAVLYAVVKGKLPSPFRELNPTTPIDIVSIFIIICTLVTVYYQGDQINEVYTGGACSTHGRDEKLIKEFSGKGFHSRQRLGIFLFTTAFRTALGPTSTPIQRVQGALSLGVKLTNHTHLLPRSKNEWSYTSTPQYALMAWCSAKAQEQLYLYIYLYVKEIHFVLKWFLKKQSGLLIGFIWLRILSYGGLLRTR
jgi:hypothetical protein